MSTPTTARRAQEIALDRIEVGGNVRELDAEHVTALAGSMAVRGLIVPIAVRPLALERVAVGPHGLRSEVGRRRVGAEDRAEGSVNRGVGAPRFGRALAGGDLGGARGEPSRIDELAGERRGERQSARLELMGHGAEHGQGFGRVRECPSRT